MSENDTKALSSKMELRHELVSIISKYKNISLIHNHRMIKDIERLKSLGDKEYILRFLLSEMIEGKTANADVCALFAMEVASKELFEKVSIDFLMSKKIDDNKKFFLISILKQKGVDIDYSDISDYITDADDIARDGVRKFLKDITVDFEVQIDLLDFYTNISDNEKISLIENMLYETDIDNISLVLSLIIQLSTDKDFFCQQEFNLIVDNLPKLRSRFAISGLEHIIANFRLNLKQSSKVRNALSELHKEFNGFKYDEVLSNSSVYKTYISFVDGQSNFSLIFSRIEKKGLIEKDIGFLKVFLATINLDKGIVSCMGFSDLMKDNFIVILQRLFCDSMPIEISPVALKGIINHYSKLNIESKTLIPYEFIIWKNLMNDVNDINYDIKEFMASKLDTVNLADGRVKKLLISKLLSGWYFERNENETFDKLFSEIEKRKFASFLELDSFLEDFIEKNLLSDELLKDNLKHRLLVTAYVSKLAKLKMSSLTAYSLYFDESKYFKLLISSITDKSVYYYFVEQLEKLDSSGTIFRRKNDIKYSQDEINSFIEGFENKWNLRKE